MTVLAALSVSTSAQAATYYLSPAGNDAKNGTSPTSAWRTVNRLNQQDFAPGDQILLQGGQNFDGMLNLSAEDAGTSGNPLGVGSYGSGRATINAGSGTGIYISNAANVSLSDLNIVGAGCNSNSGSGIIAENTLSTTINGLRINNVEVSGFGGNGIGVFAYNYNDSGATSVYNDVRITGAFVHGNVTGIETWGEKDFGGLTGVYVGRCRTVNNPGKAGKRGNGIVLGAVNGGTVERCVSAGNGGATNLSDGPVGIWTYSSNAVTLQFNESYDNRTLQGDGGGFDLDIGVTNSLMQYNYSHGNDGAGFLVYASGGGNVVRYNISQNDGRKNNYAAAGFFLGGAASSVDVYQNTFFMAAPAASAAPPAIKLTGGSARLRNNICVTAGSSPLLDAGATKGITLQGNAYWSSGGAFTLNWGGTTYTSLSAWRTATGQEKNGGQNTGFCVDPQLCSPGGGATLDNADNLSGLSAYKLQATSPLIDAGLNLSGAPFELGVGARDFYANAVSQGAFDIGAHEAGTALTPTTTTSPPPPTPSNLRGTGSIGREVWSGVSSNDVGSIPLAIAPSSTSLLTSLEEPTNLADNYGTRVRGYITAPQSGAYTFWIAGDDNCELWLSPSEAPAGKIKIASVPVWTNGREWNKYPEQKSASLNLVAGTRYYVEVLHKEGVGGDNMAVGWAKPGQSPSAPSEVVPGEQLSPFTATSTFITPGSGTGLKGQYFSGQNFNTLVTTRVDPQVNFDWGSGSATTSVGPDNFSVRWTGQVQALESGSYTFTTTSDDGVRLWVGDVNGAPLIDKWQIQGATPWSGTVFLNAGQKVNLRLDYYEAGGGALAQLAWTRPGQTNAQLIPQSQLYPTPQ